MPSSRGSSDPGSKPRSPALQADSLPCYGQYLKGISSLSHSIVFFLLLCIIHIRRPSYLSLLFSGTLSSVGYIFPFLPCLLLLLFPQLFVKAPQTTAVPSCISFSLGCFGHCLLYNVMNLRP